MAITIGINNNGINKKIVPPKVDALNKKNEDEAGKKKDEEINSNRDTNLPTNTRPTGNTATSSTVKNETSQPQTKAAIQLPTYTASQYAQSQSVLDAKAYLESLVSNKPGEFASENESLMDDFWNQLVGREKFSYDLNSDMLYQQAKDQYAALGKMAMQDTMGQASALTGGYGNSYASTVGNQAYQGYMQELNNNIPEYYQMALNQYNQEGNDLYNLYSMARDQYLNDYSMYRDDVSDYYTDYANAYTDYMNLLNQDYNEYLDSENRRWDSFVNEQNLAYQMHRDGIEDDKWQKEFELMEAEHNAAIEAAKVTQNGRLSASELQTFEDYLADGNVEGIARYLKSLVIQGVLDSDTADKILAQYMPLESVIDVSTVPSVLPTAPTTSTQMAQMAVANKYNSSYPNAYVPGTISKATISDEWKKSRKGSTWEF